MADDAFFHTRAVLDCMRPGYTPSPGWYTERVDLEKAREELGHVLDVLEDARDCRDGIPEVQREAAEDERTRVLEARRAFRARALATRRMRNIRRV